MLRFTSIFALIAMILCNTASAQTPCVPNDTVTTTIYPGPEVNGVGGIKQVACLGKPFNFTWTINIPTEAKIGAFDVKLDSVIVAKTDAVKNLPAGLTYSCNPPNCVFKATKLGCIGITGTVANNVAAPDSMDLQIAVTVSGKVFGAPLSLPYTLPDPAVTGPGIYKMRVRPANSVACTVGAYEQGTTISSVKMSPVPALDQVSVQLEAIETGTYQLVVIDATGRTLSSNTLELSIGENTTNIDVTHYASGSYKLLIVRNGRFASETFVVQK
jgi:hypothetical protein